ncbi:hypothetical protein ACIQVC_07970 [Streptomyces sp. NPDC101112]|uniref:hypothetical protein n=1 Tax=Streptomyces sp. NPDC101112 TaxID=3366105 RepID=UPI003800FF43
MSVTPARLDRVGEQPGGDVDPLLRPEQQQHPVTGAVVPDLAAGPRPLDRASHQILVPLADLGALETRSR